ncbi:MAG: Tad domain-containing protein [Granulosicoccus sp.]
MYKRQRGQILPLGLVFSTIMMLGAFVVFNTGQVATEKTRLANVADAAAYSGALWQARALNFQAYSNRAMVANQVAIAQAVSLRSWAAYGAVTSGNIATVFSALPIVNTITAGVDTGMTLFQRVVIPVSEATVRMSSAINRALSEAQRIMYLGTVAATPDIVNAVVEQSDRRFTAVSAYSAIGMAANLDQWRAFTTRYRNRDTQAMNERAEIINASLDDFSKKRNWKLGSWFFMILNPLVKNELIKEGTTKLTRYNTLQGPRWEWKAKDTLSWHIKTREWFSSKRVELPIGWAGAFANSTSSRVTLEGQGCGIVPGKRRCKSYMSRNEDAESFADAGIPSPVRPVRTNVSMSGYGGVNAYHALSTSSREKADPRLRLKVQVSVDNQELVTSDSMPTAGRFDVMTDTAVSAVSSISTAEVYFQRPDLHRGASKKAERANGYNPYWASRLTDTPLPERLLAFSLQRSGGNLSKASAERQTQDPGYYDNHQQWSSGDRGGIETPLSGEAVSLPAYSDES